MAKLVRVLISEEDFRDMVDHVKNEKPGNVLVAVVAYDSSEVGTTGYPPAPEEVFPLLKASEATNVGKAWSAGRWLKRDTCEKGHQYLVPARYGCPYCLTEEAAKKTGVPEDRDPENFMDADECPPKFR